MGVVRKLAESGVGSPGDDPFFFLMGEMIRFDAQSVVRSSNRVVTCRRIVAAKNYCSVQYSRLG